MGFQQVIAVQYAYEITLRRSKRRGKRIWIAVVSPISKQAETRVTPRIVSSDFA